MKRPAAMIMVALLAGCREAPHPMEPLVIPEPAKLEYINVERLKPNGEWQNELKIWDRRRIEAILAELW